MSVLAAKWTRRFLKQELEATVPAPRVVGVVATVAVVAATVAATKSGACVRPPAPFRDALFYV